MNCRCKHTNHQIKPNAYSPNESRRAQNMKAMCSADSTLFGQNLKFLANHTTRGVMINFVGSKQVNAILCYATVDHKYVQICCILSTITGSNSGKVQGRGVESGDDAIKLHQNVKKKFKIKHRRNCRAFRKWWTT